MCIAPDWTMQSVGEIMTPAVLWLAEDTPLKQAAEALAEWKVSGVPVCAPDGTMVGMLSTTDLTEFYGATNQERLVRDVMTPEIVSVGRDAPIQRAIELMAFAGVHRLPVLDDAKRLAGIVTSMDVLVALAGFPRGGPRHVGRGAPPG